MPRTIDHAYLWTQLTAAKDATSDLYRQFDRLHQLAYGLDNGDIFDLDQQSRGKYNIIRAQVNQVVNPVMETPPEISAFPGDGSTTADATLLNGHLRYLQEKCCAPDSYVNALRTEVTGGLGACKLVLDEDEDGDLEPLIEPLLPTQVFFDPAHRRPDRRDARFVFVEMEMNEDDFFDDYPKAVRTNDDPEAMNSSDVRVVKFWECYIRVRRGKEKSINRYILTATQIVNNDFDKFPLSCLPVFMCSAPIVEQNKRKVLLPLTIDLQDLQNEINFWRSEMANLIGRAPKSQWMADKSAIAATDEEAYANSATSEADAILWFDSNKGQIPKPEPIQAPELPRSYVDLCQQNLQFARDITGILPTQVQGEQASLDTDSGEALKQKRAMSAIASYHFIAPFLYMLKMVGDCYIDAIIKVCNDDKIRIAMQGDKSTQLVSFGPTQIKKPRVKNVDLESGKFGCVVKIGASFATQKQELLTMVSDWSAKNEKIAELSAGYIMRQQPVPGAEEFGNLLDSVLLPAAAQQFLAQKQDGGDPEQQVQALTMQNNQLRQQGHMQQQQLQLAEQELQKVDGEMQQLRLELKTGSDLKIRLAEMDADLQKTLASMAENTKRIIASQRSSTDLETAAIASNTSIDREDIIHHHTITQKVVDAELAPPTPPTGESNA